MVLEKYNLKWHSSKHFQKYGKAIKILTAQQIVTLKYNEEA